jgi:D-alanyl-D-alanine carboxypeptidase
MQRPAITMSFLIFAFASSAAANAAESNAALRSALKADLQQYLTARAKPEHLSGVSLSVSFPNDPQNLNVAVGATQYGGAGRAVVPGDLYQIGSNTKSFTSTAILQLEAEGKLSLDQTVGRWLPQYPAWKNVTIRRLLNMTSGIPTYDAFPPFLRAYAADPYHNWPAPALVQYVYPTTKGALPPTHGYSYSNTNYILCQLIIEKATGHSYTDEMRRRFLDNSVLHLGPAYYSSHIYPKSLLDRTVHGYFYSDDPDNAGLKAIYGKDVWDYSMSWAQGAGAIIATPEALTHWDRALYEGSVLGEKQRKELMSLVSLASGKPVTVPTPQDPRTFGLGVASMYMPKLGVFWFYEGETLGYRVTHAWFPKQNVILAIGFNSQPNAKQDHNGELVQHVYSTLHAAGKI